MAARDEVPGILHRALRGELTDREIAMIGYSAETQKAITRAIELDPAPPLEEVVPICSQTSKLLKDGLDAQ